MARLLHCLSLIVLSGSAAWSVPAPTPRAPALAWVFDIHRDKQHIPQGKVFLKVGTRRVLIDPKVQYEFSLLCHADYKDYQIPATALTACTGWFLEQGGGEDLYVIQRGNSLRVYRRWSDEGVPVLP